MPVVRTVRFAPTVSERDDPLSIVFAGGDAADTFTGTAEADTIRGHGGGDVLSGLDGADFIYGGLGADTAHGGEGNDYLLGGLTLGSDLANTTDGADILYGEAGADVIRGGWGDDQLFGGTGDDSLRGDNGADRIDGGDGYDYVSYRFDDRGLTMGVTFDASAVGTAGTVTINDGWGSTDTLINVEGVVISDTAFDDVFTGSKNRDQFSLTGGRDTVYAGAGDDLIYAYASPDTDIVAGEGDDAIHVFANIYPGYESLPQVSFTVAGGAGFDTLHLGVNNHNSGVEVALDSAGNVTTVNESLSVTASGIESLWFEGGYGADRATGGAAADQLYGGEGSDVLNGGAGDDILNGGKWGDFIPYDTLIGGKGDDAIYIDSVNDIVIEAKGEGTDTVYAAVAYTLAAGVYVENLVLLDSAYAHTAIGNGIANTLTGNQNGNILDGGKGDDILIGRGWNDTYRIDSKGDVVIELADEGDDTIEASFSYNLTSVANVENLTLIGTAALNGTGDELENRLTGNDAANVLKGGAGDDTLTGAGGADTLEGGVGDDTYIVADTLDTIVESKGQGTDSVRSSVTFALTGIYVENLTLTGSEAIDALGNSLDNVITGNQLSNRLDGGKGNDTLHGGMGVDDLVGGSGNDILSGGYGVDTLAGGSGNDTYFIYNYGDDNDIIVESKSEGTDTVMAYANFTLKAGSYVENLILAEYDSIHGSTAWKGTGNGIANRITGNQVDNTLDGAKGDDVLDGGLGADTLIGGEGNDTFIIDNAGDILTEAKSQGTDTALSSVSFTLKSGSYVENLTLTGTGNLNGTGNGLDNTLTGNSGNNTLNGGAANDTLIGGGGRDTLTGGAGADRFVFKALSDSVGATSDLITDLTNADFIDLSAIDGNTAAAGVQGFSLVSAFTNAAGQMTLSYNGPNNTTTLNLDVNGDGVTDMLVRISGDHDDFTNFIFGGG